MRKENGVRAQFLEFLSFPGHFETISPSRDTIKIEKRQGTYTSERIVDEDESGRALKGGHGFWFV